MDVIFGYMSTDYFNVMSGADFTNQVTNSGANLIGKYWFTVFSCPNKMIL